MNRETRRIIDGRIRDQQANDLEEIRQLAEDLSESRDKINQYYNKIQQIEQNETLNNEINQLTESLRIDKTYITRRSLKPCKENPGENSR